MLLAYIDEIGETGAFVSRDHPKYKTSPAFGYAGFVIPAANARRFGAAFTENKRTLFKTEIGESDPARFERKGADLFRPTTLEQFPQQVRVFNSLVGQLRSLDGALFYYADEKPTGTPKQTSLDTDARETAAMREALNRLARHAQRKNDTNILVMIDQINEKTRIERLQQMYGHILGRAADFQEMKLIVEPPMHVDSKLSCNIQFADWVAACITRAIDYQLIAASRYRWITDDSATKSLRGAFTHESKLHFWHRSLEDLHHSQIFNRNRPVHPVANGHLLGQDHFERLERIRQIKAAAERARGRDDQPCPGQP
ncbi:DUF3800 domain-containing protein [Mycolicibacterium smegmatis]|uniref:DUF3800 domain-containing protein n=1 Tax=Mycolicibacterium smegmatis (strain MKD8) TaxID=1214915 RepID=A0A2U9PV15_MYCSE|nr:DUF3800 domain-containing protein [Mycolicibacterium smegmatis]AWT55584.1 hypothetical protein D806_046250 [Mycolicibacterium smegmatis MKD8]